MSEFKGYLVKATKTGEVFPEKYMLYDTWDSNPKQKEYIKTYRNDNTRDLTKIIASGRKSTFKFTVRSVNLAGRKALKLFFDRNQLNDEGDIELEYWDDLNLTYSTGTFYQPNLEFKIISHSATDIKYKQQEMEFIEI
jgi:hypothetical protein